MIRESAFPKPRCLDPIAVLAHGTDSFAPYLQDSGELHDPVFGVPTQYGTAYHAYANAVLAAVGDESRRADHADRALRGLDAALRHTADPSRPATASGFERDTGTVRSSGNHRDFTWPPILKTFRLLRDSGRPTGEIRERISTVDIARSFHSRPPSNWASVWLSGEWIRFQEGISPYSKDTIDQWIEEFFVRINPDLGWYEEPGRPNSYDLFTRFHLADLLIEGYDGRMRGQLEQLARTGLQRSLAVQLSDGALASAHRSTGQSWTDGVQIGYFTCAARLLPDSASEAEVAAQRALASLARWQRPNGPFSPVHNVLPPTRRVGYEGYTADAHYANLALAFLAGAVWHGFRGGADELDDRASSTRVDPAPICRAVAHRGRISLQLNGAPAGAYDGFGITDLTFGAGRLLHFSSSARHGQSGDFVNLGLALRSRPGRSRLDVVAARRHTVAEPIEDGDGVLTLISEVAADSERAGYAHRLAVRPTTDGAEITESTPGTATYQSILVPYLLDPGSGPTTAVRLLDDGIRLQLGDEWVEVRTDAAIESILDLPHGYENRRGLCGLVRIDLTVPAESVRYRVRSGG
ncbi:MAG TPA: hypothetical protein VHX59_20390 [Mycobacteriales bacterium]|jgi:hypothetical protein|nr:hypothetical protein [Mycobacteriales bacterium]